MSAGMVTGIRAALETPGWITSKRLAELLSLPADAPAVPRPEPGRALSAARGALRALSWIPGGRWRTSCLYESVAECLTLRRAGVPAAVCIGVKREAAGAGQAGIAAHAWVARNEADTRFHGFSTLAVLEELREQR
ncbi:MAG: lasso peptide biosynthesis B2 protein [Gemmatimonadaceae bacterium]